ncbi:DUF4376 domain-containing protein [Acinetobacter tibetensis]|uniref:DUF4376 domain-containing protein n=1 Tax=Acinetobacter tibetensis TaxID=2943497 RepID=UPI003A4E4CB1
MKNQFRVINWTKDVTQYTQATTGVDPETNEEYEVAPQPIAGTTTFRIELSTVDMNGVNMIVGTTYVTLDRLTEYTAEAKLEITDKLAVLGLVDPREPTDLEDAKQQRWARIVAIRDGLEGEGFTYLNKPFDSDERSILRIGITAQAAMAAALTGADFSVDWTCADNSILSMTRDQVVGLPVALAAHANEIHLQARNLKVALDNAGSIAEVQLVQWPGVEYEVHEAV